MTTNEHYDDSLNKNSKSNRKAYKYKNTLNISLQSPQYYEPMNNMLEGWYNSGYNISTEVLDRLSKIDKIDKSPNFSNICNIYELIEKMVDIYLKNNDIEYKNNVIEQIFSEVIIMDNARLTEALTNLNKYKLKNLKTLEEDNSLNKQRLSDKKVNNCSIQKNQEIKKEVSYNEDIPSQPSRKRKEDKLISNKLDNHIEYIQDDIVSEVEKYPKDGDLDDSLPVDFFTNS